MLLTSFTHTKETETNRIISFGLFALLHIIFYGQYDYLSFFFGNSSPFSIMICYKFTGIMLRKFICYPYHNHFILLICKHNNHHFHTPMPCLL